MVISADELNARHRAFWRERQSRFDEQMKVPVLVEAAFTQLAYERDRGIPVSARSTLERELETATKLYGAGEARALVRQAAKGGRAAKPDALHSHIEGLVRSKPDLTCAELEEHLKSQVAPGGFIEEWLEPSPTFEFRTGVGDKYKEASKTALKDRLGRAKRNLRGSRSR